MATTGVLSAELMREVKRLQVRTRRRVDALFGGEYHSAFKGQGIEFAEVREYEAGDDVRAIDWNVTARTGRPFIKRFVEERRQTVVLAVDLSASGDFSSSSKPKRRLAAEIGAVLSMSAGRNNDLVGMMLFTDRVEEFVPPRKGRQASLRLIRDLLDYQPSGMGTDIGSALDHLANMLRRRATVFVVSDFLAPSESAPGSRASAGDSGWLRPLRRLCGGAARARKHEVIAIRISDPREHLLPALGIIEVRDTETGRFTLLDTSSRAVRQAYAARMKAHHDTVRNAFRASGCDCVEVSTDRPFVPDLAAYFRLRERRR